MFTEEELEELTTKKGCFNCLKFKNCPYIVNEKAKGRDFDEILIEDNVEFRYGCACSSYQIHTPREIVQFS